MMQAFSTIEKSLSRFLDTIKGAFARFWFLSNDELLEILSETKIVTNVQPFVKKCFEAVQSLTFDKNLMITGCTSIEGEEIKYDNPIDPNGETNGVEKWLLQVRPYLQTDAVYVTKDEHAPVAVTIGCSSSCARER
jgi:dynein heavy chain, axonemal